MIPGINLLSIATSVIGTQQVEWLKYSARVQNELGQWITSYIAQAIRGSWQPVEISKYEQWGLDLSRTYFHLYTSNPVMCVDRDRSPDIIRWNGRLYTAEKVPADWIEQDGWRSIICVDRGAFDPLRPPSDLVVEVAT